MTKERKIVTYKHVYVWTAYRDEYELDEPVGVGKTEQEAIDELLTWETMND